MKNKIVILSLVILSTTAFAKTNIDTAKQAIKHRDIKTLNELLDSNSIGPNDLAKNNVSLLSYTLLQSYHSAIVPWQADQNPDDVDSVVTTLLQHGANPNQLSLSKDFLSHSRTWETPLFTAMAMNRPGAMMTLIADSRTDVNQVICSEDRHGNKKAIGTIIQFIAPEAEVAKALQARGAVPYDPATMKCE